MRKRSDEFRAYQKEWSTENKDKRAAAAERYKQKYPERKLLKSSRNNAKSRGIEHTITLEDIIIPKVCPYLLVPLSTESNSRYGVSIDRIDPDKGYIHGNIEIISKLANRMKSDASLEELKQFSLTCLERMHYE